MNEEKNTVSPNEECTEKKSSCTCDGDHNCCQKEGKEAKKEHKNKHKELLLKAEEEKKALEEKLRYAQAELINYRKRKEEETANMLKYANQDLILEIISVIDNFERAIKLDDNDLTDELSKFLAGFKMIYATLTDILRKYGVEEISRVGEIFDPAQEEALMTDSLEEYEDDEVLEVLLKGYKLKDRVIRPASVKVNKK